jgi:CHAT domain-containing protein
MPGTDSVKYELVKYQLSVGSEGIRLLRETRQVKGKPTGPLMTEPYPIRLDPKDKLLTTRTLLAFVKMLRDNRIRVDEAALLGEYLHKALLENPIGDELHKLLHEHDDVFLRVDLVFEDPNSDLANLPWEYLYRPYGDGSAGSFLASHGRFALVRSPRRRLTRPLRVPTGEVKVKVLFVASSPYDRSPVEFDSLRQQIQELQGTQLEVATLVTQHTKDPAFELEKRGEAQATYETFKDVIRTMQPHVIHFVGHGECGKEGGEIAFVDTGYKAHSIHGSKLAEDLEQHNSVRLVFLQACESAMVDPTAPYEALSSVAGSLAFHGIPAVVAMQSKVENKTANEFAEAFYKALVQRMPIFQAVQLARAKIQSKDALGIPVLYWIKHENEEGILFPDQHEDAEDQIQSGSRSQSVSNEAFPTIDLIGCPWCTKSISRYDKQGDVKRKCEKCGCLIRCPNCDQLIEDVAKNQSACYCVKTGCNGVIWRQKPIELEPVAQRTKSRFEGRSNSQNKSNTLVLGKVIGKTK